MAQNTYEPTSGILLYYDTLAAADPASTGTAMGGIAEITSLPKLVADEFETTRIDQMDGTSHDWFKQHAPDHIDPGTLECKLALDGTQTAILYGVIRTMQTFEILFPSGGKIIFDGYLKSIGPEANKGGEVLVDVIVRVSGKPVYTAA